MKPRAESFPSWTCRGSDWSRIPWSCSGLVLEKWVVEVHVRLVPEIVESGWKEEGEVVCFSESSWDLNWVLAWVPVALVGPEVLVELAVDWVPVEEWLMVLASHRASVSIRVFLLAFLSE